MKAPKQKWQFAGLAAVAVVAGAYLSSAASSTNRAEVSTLPGLVYSDDFGRHADAFARAAADLIEKKRCAPSDFQGSAGFYKAEQPDAYFAFCGTTRIDNRVFIEVKDGSYAVLS